MNLDYGFHGTVQDFARHISLKPYSEMVAPGRSAKAMVELMIQYACQHNWQLPLIHVLSHEDSVSLCEGDVRVLPKLRDSKNIVVLDDFLITGTKPKLIHDNFSQRHGIKTSFEIMVGFKPHTESYVSVFRTDELLSTELNLCYAERDSF